ncbi:MAG: hypothetical protein IPK58_08500 [Acidobacteria bacterium]|nr:hypothetical protein [Acidobacteriota bacterium]
MSQIFGDGTSVAATLFNPPIQQSNGFVSPMSPRLFDESVSRSGTIHLYASFNGLGRLVVNVFAPPGFVFQGGYAGPKRGGGEFQNATVIYYERGKLAKYGWSGDLRINFTHIGPTDGAGNYIEQSGAANEIGSRPIGVAGNYGGEYPLAGPGAVGSEHTSNDLQLHI